MAQRFSILRHASILGCVTLACGLGGCTMSKNSVAFTNVSDTFLNVQFFVGHPDTDSQKPNELVSESTLQVEPGKTASYALTRHQGYSRQTSPLVHVQVEPVSPSWRSSGKTYWLELLTHPPINIVATGSADRLEFHTGIGATAIIPEREFKRGRFEHKTMATVTGQSGSSR